MQVRVYDLESMSCHYVLAGHTETVLCVDTCVSSSGSTLIVTGSKDKDVSFFELCLLIGMCAFILVVCTWITCNRFNFRIGI